MSSLLGNFMGYKGKITSDRGSYAGLNDFIDMIRGMIINDDLDALIGVSGFKGYGKSSFSKQFVKRYTERFCGIKRFTPKMLEQYTIYTVNDLDNALVNLPPYTPIDADEAVNFAMGEDWMRGKNKSAKKKMAKIRNKHHVFLFNIPDLWWLDKKYRDNMMTVWIHIVKKGHVMVALPNTAPGIEDRWYRKWLIKIFTSMPINYFTEREKIMKKLRRYPCYFDEFAVPKLNAKIYQKHLDLRNAKTMVDGTEEKEINARGLTQRQKAMLVSPIFKIKTKEWQSEHTEIVSNGGWTDKKLWETFYKESMSLASFKRYKEIAGVTKDTRSQILMPSKSLFSNHRD